MGIGIALLTLLGIGLLVNVFDDDDDDNNATDATEPEGVVRNGTEDADTIEGTVGTDLLTGGDGDDTLGGGESSDTIQGGTGDDLLEGDAGNDRLLGEADDDVIIGGGGDDQIAAGSGNDFVQGRGGDDTMTGSLGTDWLEGDDGNDSATGGFGDDTLLGGEGADTLVGGGGDDLLISTAVPGTPLSVSALEALRDSTQSFEDILGVSADTAVPLEDDDTADVLDGGEGNDDLLLGAGDTGTGGEGDDRFVVLAEAAMSDNGPSTITDFDVAEDGLLVLLDADAPDPVTVDVTDEDGDAIILVNGEPISVLQGAAGQLEAGDIGLGNGIVVSFLDPA